MKADQFNHSVKVIDQTKKDISRTISVTRQKVFEHFTEDTASQPTNYRGINIFLVKKIYRLESIRGKRFL